MIGVNESGKLGCIEAEAAGKHGLWLGLRCCLCELVHTCILRWILDWHLVLSG
jgi:hypothetical protein